MGKLGILIFDVEHGFCAFVRSPNGYGLLIDCGRSEGFSPVRYLIDYEIQHLAPFEGHSLAKFILTHPHDDHLNDVEALAGYMRPAVMSYQTYDWEEVKSGGALRGEYANLDMFSAWQESYDRQTKGPDWGMNLETYWLTPRRAKELDEAKFVNNSSIVTVVEWKGFKAVFPGDLEEAGWRELLGDRNFANSIRGATLFVASHHGHSSGYCREIFEAMGRPVCNVVSARAGDDNVSQAYSSPENAEGFYYEGGTRRMFSTRNDGSIFVEVGEDGKGILEAVHLDCNVIPRHGRQLPWENTRM